MITLRRRGVPDTYRHVLLLNTGMIDMNFVFCFLLCYHQFLTTLERSHIRLFLWLGFFLIHLSICIACVSSQGRNLFERGFFLTNYVAVKERTWDGRNCVNMIFCTMREEEKDCLSACLLACSVKTLLVRGIVIVRSLFLIWLFLFNQQC